VTLLIFRKPANLLLISDAVKVADLQLWRRAPKFAPFCDFSVILTDSQEEPK
jgi:hypothetical protein